MDFMKNLLSKFWADNKEQLKKATFSAIRYFMFLVVAWLVSYVGQLPPSQTTAFGLVVLTFVDKWIHENWKANDKTGLKGLSPL